MINWIVWNRTILTFNCVWIKKKLCLYQTGLFEINLFICIKMDLALITYKGWCTIKPNQNLRNIHLWISWLRLRQHLKFLNTKLYILAEFNITNFCNFSFLSWIPVSVWFDLVVWGLWHINLCRLFNAKSIFIQIISSISNNSV